MAGVGHPPFTNDEKNFLLAEMIKSVSPNPAVLLNVINHLNIHPRWDDMPLPSGRSVNACRAAFDEIRRGALYSPLSQSGSIATPLSAPVPTLKRSVGLEGPFSAGRALLPKTLTHPYTQTATAEQPLKRKRGRPTKAEQQARMEFSSGTGEPSNLATRFQTPLSASVPPSPLVDPRPTSVPTVSRVPISTIITTPTAPKSASQSSSSSGKRRRVRSMRSEIDAAQAEGGGPAQAYESPYARIPGDADDTPAKSAAMRQHEGRATSSLSQPIPFKREPSPRPQPGAQRLPSPKPPSRGPT